MSAEEVPVVSTSFLSLKYLKRSLGLNLDKTINDTELLDIIDTANQEVDARLKPYLGSTPIVAGSEIFVQAKRATSRLARTEWYERQGQLDRAKHSEEIFDKKMEMLIKAVIADKPERTQTVFITQPDPLDRIYQPSQADEYIAREFF